MYYIGLDVASRSSFVYVIDSRGKKIESKEIPTDKDGYRQFFREWSKKAVYIAVEAGGHTRWIHDTITKLLFMGGESGIYQEMDGCSIS